MILKANRSSNLKCWYKYCSKSCSWSNYWSNSDAWFGRRLNSSHGFIFCSWSKSWSSSNYSYSSINWSGNI